MGKLEVIVTPIYNTTKVEVEFPILGVSEEDWVKLPESAKERILDLYLSTNQPKLTNFWSLSDWVCKKD